jgi:hypothetical protein
MGKELHLYFIQAKTKDSEYVKLGFSRFLTSSRGDCRTIPWDVRLRSEGDQTFVRAGTAKFLAWLIRAQAGQDWKIDESLAPALHELLKRKDRDSSWLGLLFGGNPLDYFEEIEPSIWQPKESLTDLCIKIWRHRNNSPPKANAISKETEWLKVTEIPRLLNLASDLIPNPLCVEVFYKGSTSKNWKQFGSNSHQPLKPDHLLKVKISNIAQTPLNIVVLFLESDGKTKLLWPTRPSKENNVSWTQTDFKKDLIPKVEVCLPNDWINGPYLKWHGNTNCLIAFTYTTPLSNRDLRNLNKHPASKILKTWNKDGGLDVSDFAISRDAYFIFEKQAACENPIDTLLDLIKNWLPTGVNCVKGIVLSENT